MNTTATADRNQMKSLVQDLATTDFLLETFKRKDFDAWMKAHLDADEPILPNGTQAFEDFLMDARNRDIGEAITDGYDATMIYLHTEFWRKDEELNQLCKQDAKPVAA